MMNPRSNSSSTTRGNGNGQRDSSGSTGHRGGLTSGRSLPLAQGITNAANAATTTNQRRNSSYNSNIISNSNSNNNNNTNTNTRATVNPRLALNSLATEATTRLATSSSVNDADAFHQEE
jgi:hypothetical protein